MFRLDARSKDETRTELPASATSASARGMCVFPPSSSFLFFFLFFSQPRIRLIAHSPGSRLGGREFKAIFEKLKKFPATIRKKLGYRNRWVLK